MSGIKGEILFEIPFVILLYNDITVISIASEQRYLQDICNLAHPPFSINTSHQQHHNVVCSHLKYKTIYHLTYKLHYNILFI